jgi:hypothetical protein
MELDKALRLAVVQAWKDLLKDATLCSVRVEYEQTTGTSLDQLHIWADMPKGYQFLICRFLTNSTSACPSGPCFANGYHSDKLAQSLNFIMANQDQFSHPFDASRYGLVLIYPPADEEPAETAAWMSAVHGRATNLASSAA